MKIEKEKDRAIAEASKAAVSSTITNSQLDLAL
jgi:hypothetical protein